MAALRGDDVEIVNFRWRLGSCMGRITRGYFYAVLAPEDDAFGFSFRIITARLVHVDQVLVHYGGKNTHRNA